MTGGAQDSGVERGKVTPEMMQAWTNFEPVIPNTPPSQLRDSVLLRQGFMAGWMAANRATPTPAGWQPIETCDTWRFDHMTPMIAYWPTRGPRETYYDVDEEFHLRPKGWASPEEGWRSPGDQCIPIESHQPTHWREFPAAPTAPAEGGV